MSEAESLVALRAALLEQMPGGGGSRNRINRDRINGLVDAALADERTRVRDVHRAGRVGTVREGDAMSRKGNTA